MGSDWSKRVVVYEQLHNIQKQDLVLAASLLDMRNGDVVVDAMCGYGSMSREIMKIAQEQQISIELIMLDVSKDQLARSHEYVSDESCKKVVTDILDWNPQPESVDSVILKMGLHEVSRFDQQRVFDTIYSALRPQGVFVLWAVAESDSDIRDFFHDVVQEKDRLAGYSTLVKKRYLNTASEILECFENSGFSEYSQIKEISYRLCTKKRLDSEFESDQSKLDSWNEFIRSHSTGSLREKVSFEDDAQNICMTFKKAIFRGIK